MTFTDDDLKRLKDQCEEYEHDGIEFGDGLMSRNDVQALLARLEAAELCAEHGKLLSAYLSRKEPDAFEQGAIEVWVRREEAWRKVKGDVGVDK